MNLQKHMQSKFISSQNLYLTSFQDYYVKFQISKRQKD